MDYLFAKISKRGADNIRTVLSDKTVYQIPNLDNTTEYNDELKLDEGQWFKLDGFSEKEYFPQILEDGINAVEKATITNAEFENIKYLISVQNDELYLFQRVLQGSVVSKRGVLSFFDEPKFEENQTLIIINEYPDAVYNKTTDKLYFKDLSRIRPFFSGIEVLLKEATEQELDNFIGLDLINVKDGFDKSKIGLSNRRRVRTALQQYDSMSENDKSLLNDYIKKYRPQLNYDEDSTTFEIGSDEDVKNLIFGIDQRYYTTEISKEQRIANSVSVIE